MKKRIIAVVAFLALIVAIFGLPPFSGGPSGKYLSDAEISNFQNGVHRQSNGTYEVSAFTPMPGVDAKMVRWWFADYMQTTEHYQRWYPGAHVWMDWENKVPGEYVGASHLVHEYIGDELMKLRIQFVPHEEILGDIKLKTDDVAVCARVGLLEKPVNVAKMCHIIRNNDAGAVMLSRFWMGQVQKRDRNQTVGSIEGIIGNTYLARKVAIRQQNAIDLKDHALQEMGILAGFLPELYENEISE
ncbi:MAG: hypothetical protein HKN36_00410 [Hellea sp.]|nr:hypothetical protein [Hellea sp.]